MFLPSGRVHAIGAGLVIFEIQQNSDTTYRVFDWNRVGLDGKPRELHVPQSLASIDFNDSSRRCFRGLSPGTACTRCGRWCAIHCSPPRRSEAGAGASVPLRPNKMQIIALVAGRVQVCHGVGGVTLAAGQFCLVPASLAQVTVRAETAATFLRIEV